MCSRVRSRFQSLQLMHVSICKKLHYQCPDEKPFISHAGHWISRVVGEGIWSIMKQAIDFPPFIWRTWHEARGHFPPQVHWLNVILSFRGEHTYHLFSIFLCWRLGIWATFVKCEILYWKQPSKWERCSPSDKCYRQVIIRRMNVKCAKCQMKWNRTIASIAAFSLYRVLEQIPLWKSDITSLQKEPWFN